MQRPINMARRSSWPPSSIISHSRTLRYADGRKLLENATTVLADSGEGTAGVERDRTKVDGMQRVEGGAGIRKVENEQQTHARSRNAERTLTTR